MRKPVNRTKVHIAQAAIELFSRQGFGSTSIREIAQKANVNSALISYHFKNKQGVLEMIMIEYFENLFERFAVQRIERTTEAFNYFDELMKIVQLLIRYQCEHIKVTRMIQRELSVDSTLVREVMSTYIAKLKALFTSLADEGISAGQFRADLNQDMKLIHVLSSIFFPYFNPQIIREVFYVDPMSEEYIETYIQYLANIWRSQFVREN
ncbi:forespore capture DNA-binding protein RefZ [Ammoniphilus oxalaticus]|uniref:forespore capture DNA-binding protein RefZ n=1 Tax=Ammoniphilus oxalaticus TaxID=66863 RepID=UPI0014748B26|nr:forespore capture DNA-binding protein RefZ [Ammoniphilus oxalaticus]